MILPNLNAVFFHVPKTGGHSIEQYLLPGRRDYRVFHSEILFGLDRGTMTQHLTYRGMLAYRPRKVLDSSFKFAFFRNTWDRISSAFFYAEQHFIDKHGSFGKFIDEICLEVERGIYPEGWHFARQTDYLYTPDGAIALDFLGRFERIQEDFEEVCRRLGVEYHELPKRNSSKNSKTDSREIFTCATRERIANAYGEEIEHFGYEFPSAQLTE